MVKVLSKSFSFDGWDIWEFLKGRKKMVVTVVAVILGYLITNNEVIAIVSGGTVEMVFAVLEYYSKEIKK